jgi:glycosyltransferase involved in cell wall biosynthesis
VSAARVCAITSGTVVPASRFRIRQHIPVLGTLGVDVTEYVPLVPQAMPLPGPLARLRRRHLAPVTAGWIGLHALARVPAMLASWRADCVWLERTFVPGLDALVRLLRSPLVLDADDAVWLEGLAGRGTPALARRAEAVIAGNSYLAGWFSQYCRRVHVVPTAVDAQKYRPAAVRPARAGLVLGWTGTSGNFRYLADIQPALRRVLREVAGASLVVVADRAPRLPELAGLPVRFVRWTLDDEVRILHTMDIGLMPLADDPWTRGKCSFKMLQYMAAGLPTVVSPVGMNADVLALGESGIAARSTDEWTAGLLDLARDPERRTSLGAAGRRVVSTHFDVPVVARELAAVFHRIVSDSPPPA